MGSKLRYPLWAALHARAYTYTYGFGRVLLQGLLITQGAFALALFASFGMLVLYHVFLMHKGFGTYDWIVHSYTQQRQAAAAAQTV